MRCRNFSNARRRDSTNSNDKLPTACFSGNAGIIIPGNCFDNSDDNHSKSENLRFTS